MTGSKSLFVLRSTIEFLTLMRAKLFENIHKSTWENETYAYLRKRLSDEVDELDRSIKDGDYANARLECADIANFAMMISDNLKYDRFDEFKEE